MLQNARVTDFTISEFFRENQQMVKWLLEFKEVYLNSSPVPLTIFYEPFRILSPDLPADHQPQRIDRIC